MSEINSIVDLLSWEMKEGAGAEMFRGQALSEWPLLPGISRYSETVMDCYDAVAHVEEHLIEDFEKYSVPYCDLRQLSYTEKLVHAQHHGLPTRLLDWSTNLLKALFYAVEDARYDSFDGALYGYTPTTWYDSTKHVKFDESLITFFPELINERVASQEGCFTSFPLESELGFNVTPLSKEAYPKEVDVFASAIIPSTSKRKLRIELAKLGITRRTLFPGLDGLASWLRSDHTSYLL